MKTSQSAANFLPGLGPMGTLVVFGLGALLLLVATRVVIPALASQIPVEPVLLWFLAGGLGVFVPLFILSVVMLRGEPARSLAATWFDRLRFRPLTAADWLWCLSGLAIVGLLSAATLLALRTVAGAAPLHPPLLTVERLAPGRYWILLAWLPFWLLNIFGEEILWRGVVLPRQEVVFGRWAWLANGAGWALFHVAFGATLVVILWPILLILPYVAQRRRNSWTGVFIHAGLNGPGFLAVAFALV
jgi:membrane protease YdiL (CAAX protease family)